MERRKALLIGDYTNAIYHPLSNVEKEIKSILADRVEIVCTEDTEYLKPDKLSGFDLLISYADFWEKKLEQHAVAGIVSFVCNGRGLLAIHTGISYQKNYEFAQMIGGRFTEHPEFQTLHYRATAHDHPIMKSITDFSAGDEPYQFEMDNFSEKTILFEYTLNGMNKPAGWALEYGLGRSVYLMPGHTTEPFLNPVYRTIIINSADWLLR